MSSTPAQTVSNRVIGDSVNVELICLSLQHNPRPAWRATGNPTFRTVQPDPREVLRVRSLIRTSQTDGNAAKPLWRRFLKFSNHLAAAGPQRRILGQGLPSISEVARIKNVVVVHIYNCLTNRLAETANSGKCQTEATFSDVASVRMPRKIPLVGERFFRRVVH